MASLDTHQWLRDARKKYIEAKELGDQQSEDLEKEPFKLKYKAAEILRELRIELNKLGTDDKLLSSQLNVVRAVLEYELGVIAYETDEPCTCDEHHKKCWDLVKDHATEQEYVYIAVNVLNSLGVLRASRGEQEEARDYLKQAEILYGEYKLSKKDCPYLLTDLFVLHDNSFEKNSDWKYFEKAVTHTLYYLAQVYEHLGESEASAKYCHITLKRQLDSNEYDPLDWAVNCANMSQYFAAKERFSAARHVLACANYVMSQYKEKLEQEEKSDDDERWDNYEHGMADISMCWSKYVLLLMATSLDKKMETAAGNGEGPSSPEGGENDDIIQAYRFFKETQVKDLENQVTCCLITDFDLARGAFLAAIKFLEQAKSYYTLNNHAYDHVQIIQDNSKLYKLLAAFETDKSRQCKMHKRRIDMLEGILKRLNPQHYLSLCQQLMFELAETYSEMADIKISLMNSEGKKQVSPHTVKKINFLLKKSIEHYESFIDSMRDPKKQLPETFDDSCVRPVLVAHFCLARLYSKMIVPDRNKEIEHLKLSEECYNFVIKYVEKNPKHESSVSKELPVIKEMAALISLKIKSFTSPA